MKHHAADAIVQVVGHRRVGAVDENTSDCAGRPGGVLRFSELYAAGADSVIVFAQHSAVARGAVPACARQGGGHELEFHLTRRDGEWRIVNRRTVPGSI